MRELIKKIRKLALESEKAAGGEPRQRQEEALKLLPQAYKAIDKAAKTNVIKKNTAARKKSRLTKLINKIGKPAATRQDEKISGGKQVGPPQSKGLGGEPKKPETKKEEKSEKPETK